MSLQLRNSFLLLLTAIIWGIAFVAQSVGMDYIGPFTFNCVRFILGGIVLIPVIYFLKKFGLTGGSEIKEDKITFEKGSFWQENKSLLIAGICCGLCLFGGASLQQIGILYTTVGKAGFITAFYIIIVPLLGLFLKKRCGIALWLGVVLALLGLYFLCITESFTIGKGDIFEFLCAVMFAFHILTIDYFIDKVDPVKLSCVQFFVCGFVNMIPMFIFEDPQVNNIILAWKPIAYAGIMSSGVAYTLQIVGQKGLNPTVASLIMSLESVVSVLAGFILLNQELSMREIWGCVLMFIAIVLAQLPDKKS